MIVVFLRLSPFCLLSRELSFMLHSIISDMIMCYTCSNISASDTIEYTILIEGAVFQYWHKIEIPFELNFLTMTEVLESFCIGISQILS